MTGCHKYQMRERMRRGGGEEEGRCGGGRVTFWPSCGVCIVGR